MNEFEFGIELQLAVLAFVLLLIIVLIIFMVRRRIPKKVTPDKDSIISDLANQTEEVKLATKQLSDTEHKKESFVETEADVPISKNESFVEIQTNQTAVTSKPDNLPQDSMLRRHYLTHIRAMIESLKLPRPTDSTLCRHYDALLIAEVEQCLSDEAAMARLIRNYEDQKKFSNQQIQKSAVIAESFDEAVISREEAVTRSEKFKLPEDSVLRRHALTHLYALVEANMPVRPTDSVLRRHYDTMINYEVKKLL